MCFTDGCNIPATRNLSGLVPSYCARHASLNMINVMTQCIENECKLKACYNMSNEKKGIYCSSHKKEGMIDVKSKRCIEENCTKQPSYNFPGETKFLYCKGHKKEGMINVKQPNCYEINCTKQPCYNYIGEKKGVYCYAHKKDTMIDVKSKRCIEENCMKQPSYNYKDMLIPLYCILHKLDGMVDVKHKTCIEENCTTRPNYNYVGEKEALYCLEHKKPEMVNVVNKTCIYENCLTRAHYNEQGKLPIYCLEHKKEGMINVVSKTCMYENCPVHPLFNYENVKPPIYCDKHKKEGMINVVSKRCKSEWCSTVVANKYEGYCLFCYIHIFPDKPAVRNYKTKETAVVDFIKSQFLQVDWNTDKIIKDGCSKRRPDLLLDLGYQVIIIEIDENQHIDYDCTCENKRVMELSRDLGHRPIVFIRFNPDGYSVKNKIIPSCWHTTKARICAVKMNKKLEWESRLNSLKESVEYWMEPENKTDKMVEYVQLFYDE